MCNPLRLKIFRVLDRLSVCIPVRTHAPVSARVPVCACPCVCMCPRVYTCSCVSMSGGQRSASAVIPQRLATLFSETGALTGWEPAGQARLFGLGVPGKLLISSSRCWGAHTTTPSFLYGFWGIKLRSSSPGEHISSVLDTLEHYLRDPAWDQSV